MKNERILASKQDLNFRDNQKSLNDISWDIGVVTEVFRNDESEFASGIIRCKLLKNYNTTSNIDKTDYRPINPNTTNTPIIGEFVLVLNTPGVGSYYLTSLNYFDSINSNAPKNINNFVIDSESEFIQKNLVKTSNINSVTLNEKSSKLFSEKDVQRTTRKIGDITLEGRYGNFISLTYESVNSNIQKILNISNSSSFIRIDENNSFPEFLNDRGFNVDTNVDYSESSPEKIVIESDKIFLRSKTSGMFMESVGTVGIASNQKITLDSTSRISISSDNRIDLGFDASQRAILGNSFLSDWVVLLNALKVFASDLSNYTDNSAISTIGQKLKQSLTEDKISSNFLSKLVYLK